MGQYCLLMGIRMACIIAIFLTPQPWGWLWVLGAVVLPYMAVVIANAAGEARKVNLNVAPKRQRTALGATAAEQPPADQASAPVSETSDGKATDDVGETRVQSQPSPPAAGGSLVREDGDRRGSSGSADSITQAGSLDSAGPAAGRPLVAVIDTSGQAVVAGAVSNPGLADQADDRAVQPGEQAAVLRGEVIHD